MVGEGETFQDGGGVVSVLVGLERGMLISSENPLFDTKKVASDDSMTILCCSEIKFLRIYDHI